MNIKLKEQGLDRESRGRGREQNWVWKNKLRNEKGEDYVKGRAEA